MRQPDVYYTPNTSQYEKQYLLLFDMLKNLELRKLRMESVMEFIFVEL